MNPTLSAIIEKFRQAQDLALVTIRNDLGWKLPSTNREWVGICSLENYHQVRELNGIQIYTHGYGIEITYPDLSIDFDWGDRGEGTGFDAWRLWMHCLNNDLFLDQCTHDEIQTWLVNAHQLGELLKDSRMWYRTHEYKHTASH